MSDTNCNIYEKRLTAAHPSERFDHIPLCIYFYYITFDQDRLRVDHFFYNNGPVDDPGQWKPIAPGDVAALLPDLVANARSSGENPPVSGHNFQDVVWTYKSHMVIVMDAAAWAFRKGHDETGAIAFNVGKGSTPNNSFFDAQDIEVRIPAAGGEDDVRSAIAFINHMKRNSDGDDLGHETQHFKFDAYLEVRYGGPDAPSMVVILDPDGQNQGPPNNP